ncbi:hypothetical protein M409DRAFT_22266 [Zasmidium cellare ATCC 36951]|uniref:F-box domain-containing protein n=1 Tax=Zasmidium cellare ATCC 36951 TaxID=1080233 RepID=A0A6A6CML9_ZASCE|nr:uncharacterized protein M409DRAFT_22266 [Zasmidium cellare ATCC 36951]KAF2167458.1 hypothetical protein M409DRAFT_22266 [Zasmidium cellare ATCC 36951]
MSAPPPTARLGFPLPAELLEEVLLQLPHIRDIARCKAVCRQFRDAIKTSPSFRFMPFFPFADDKRVMKTVFSKRNLFYGQPSPFVTCINPIFAMQVVNLRISYGELFGCWWTSSTDSPSYNPVTGIVRIRWQLARDASFGRPRITSKKILNMRIDHPRVRTWMDMCIRSVPKMSGEIKPETTIREFLEWSDVLDLDEKRASNLFVKEPIIHA